MPPPQPLRGANIGCDVVRRTIFAGPRPDVIPRVRERGSIARRCGQWVADDLERVDWRRPPDVLLLVLVEPLRRAPDGRAALPFEEAVTS